VLLLLENTLIWDKIKKANLLDISWRGCFKDKKKKRKKRNKDKLAKGSCGRINSSKISSSLFFI
jgi:hypothetical protein